MSLRQTLRKAAELLVELPPEEAPQPASNAAGSPSTDKLWEDLERAAKKTDSPIPMTTPPAKTVEQIVREAQGPDLDQIQVSATLPTSGSIDYSQIYRQANLPPAPFTAEQALEMIDALPKELPLETRRQTVRISINAMGKAIGATPETVVADASRKLAALAAYSESVAHQTAEMIQNAEQAIAALQLQMEEKRRAIQEAQQLQGQVTQACVAESDRLDDILEFFSLDVPPSKYASPQ